MFDRFLRLFPGSTSIIVRFKSKEVEVEKMASGSQTQRMKSKYRDIPLTEVSNSAWEKLGKSMDLEKIDEISSYICEHSDGDQLNLEDQSIIRQSGEPEKMLKRILLNWKNGGKQATLGDLEELLKNFPQISGNFLDLCSKFTVVTRVHLALSTQHARACPTNNKYEYVQSLY